MRKKKKITLISETRIVPALLPDALNRLFWLPSWEVLAPPLFCNDCYVETGSNHKVSCLLHLLWSWFRCSLHILCNATVQMCAIPGWRHSNRLFTIIEVQEKRVDLYIIMKAALTGFILQGFNGHRTCNQPQQLCETEAGSSDCGSAVKTGRMEGWTFLYCLRDCCCCCCCSCYLGLVQHFVSDGISSYPSLAWKKEERNNCTVQSQE